VPQSGPAGAHSVSRSPPKSQYRRLTRSQSQGGNESTSVGLSFPRKRRFSVRNSRLLVTSTLTAPRNLTARPARATNFAKAASLNPSTCFLKMTKRFFAFFAVSLRVLRSQSLFLTFFLTSPKTNRRAKSRHPPAQSYLLYSLVSTSVDDPWLLSGGAIAVPLALPFALDSGSDVSPSATRALCSS
jgi:hypothetical protein